MDSLHHPGVVIFCQLSSRVVPRLQRLRWPNHGRYLPSVPPQFAKPKKTPLLSMPPTLTTIFPVVAPTGTVQVMLVSLQRVTVAVVPLNFTELPLCDAPKLEPEIVTDTPGAPLVCESDVIAGGTGSISTTALIDAGVPLVSPVKVAVSVPLVGTTTEEIPKPSFISESLRVHGEAIEALEALNVPSRAMKIEALSLDSVGPENAFPEMLFVEV